MGVNWAGCFSSSLSMVTSPDIEIIFYFVVSVPNYVLGKKMYKLSQTLFSYFCLYLFKFIHDCLKICLCYLFK